MTETQRRIDWINRIVQWRLRLGEAFDKVGNASGEGQVCVCLWMRMPCGLHRCLEVHFNPAHVAVLVHPIDPF